METRKENRMVKYVLVLLVLAAATGATACTSAPEHAATREPELQGALDQLVAAGAPGAIALVREGDRTIRLTSGYGNLKPRARLHASDRFRVGSVTKTFVATVVLQLVGEGKLSLDDTVERWLPGVVPNGRAITVRHLLNHTAGLFDYLGDGDKTVERRVLSGDWNYQWKPRELVAISTAHKAKFAPGTGWSYCNTCYILLGLIVEEATGNSITAELRKRVFEPAGLRATSLDARPRISGRHARGYELLGTPPLVDFTALSPSLAWTAGALVSTADDLARFYRTLLGGRLLRPDLLRTMQTTVPVAARPGWRWGLGINKRPSPCGAQWGHDGGYPGYRTWALNSKEGKRQIVVFTNLGEDSSSEPVERALERVLVTAYCSSQP
jgi:D-alanyl-D-alanine carboxypeptidase